MVAASGPAAAGDRPGATSPYYGRWTVDEARPVFTARGRLYKTIDVAPCGRDFCGVSVGDAGACGPVLFRFLSRSAMLDELRGHGKWGEAQKNVVVYNASDADAGTHAFELYLGDGHDFGGRSDSMPKFHANYRRLGGAKCTAR
jgi:hypothetical protein